MKLPAIPYMGSKRSVAEDIVKLIRIKNPNAKYFYDVFGGGGAVSIQALHQGFYVYYNEYQPRVANLMQFLKDLNGKGLPAEWYEWIDREKFKEIIKSDRTDAYAGMVQQCWSFGNRGATYIFGKEIERLKELSHKLVVHQSSDARLKSLEEFGLDFEVPKEEKIYDRYLNEFKPRLRELKASRLDLQQLEQLQRLEQLEQLQRLERLEQLKITNLSYDEVKITTPLDETVVYCDPPYRGTEKYVTGEFDFLKFDEWFKNLPCTGFLSEYNSPHEEIKSIKIIKRSLLARGDSEVKYNQEKIYWNGK